MSHDKNDDLRESRADQDEHRQELRDEVFDETTGGEPDFGSQDERRHQHEPRL